ncbi:FAD-binding oxidoreductase [Nocardia transvalensis]|uniref:FAD-binding oxidoreductase n=1 Tax=Nocardia transvalensis TaxID=37333 RepID=UPI0018943409|nr:FAD-binding protein [Nocardia transvalensis]MBF6328123.1 FAD-binding protein [Nocardia transvalensis]
MSLTRRGFIAAAALGAAAASGGSPVAQADARVVNPGESDYSMLTLRGYNRRFVAQPRRVHVPGGAEEVGEAVARSVRDRLRIAVRSGGHCFDDFVDSAQVIVDLGRMNDVRWDEQYRAFSVGAGAELGAVYTALGRWGVTVPAGICKGVGAGGHISGGGYGPLSRRHGLVADHLYGVEMVTVDARGDTSVVVATADGPHRDLWWAHTGGGGGNFGVVTRFLLRSPDSDGADPARALPRPPATMLTARLFLPVTTEESFVRFLGNYLDFFSRHRDPGNPYAGLYAPLNIRPTGTGFAEMLILLDADPPDAQARLDSFIAAVTDGVVPGALIEPPTRASYADTVDQAYYAKAPTPPRVKIKAAYLRRPYTREQLRICYRHMVDPSVIGESQLEFLPFGGAINAIAPGATAMPARDSFMKMLIHAAWRLPTDDDHFIGWARRMYREIYADTGGVPVPDDRNSGSYINYPDPDLADPSWNASAVPWHAFYYGSGYPRLQQVKAAWDPNDVFRHRLSIELP